MADPKQAAAKALATKRENQIRYGRITGLPAGTMVKVNHPRDRVYNGRRGEVKEHNLGEVGVDFGAALVWFMPNQLVRV